MRRETLHIYLFIDLYTLFNEGKPDLADIKLF